MGALLAILNVIWIIFQVILWVMLFVILLLAYVICAPFCYRIYLSHRKKTSYKFKVSTFLRFLSISGDSSLDKPITIRIFWIFKLKLNNKPKGIKEQRKEDVEKEHESEKFWEEFDEEIKKSEKRKLKKEEKAERKSKRSKTKSKIKESLESFRNFKNYPHKKTIFKAFLRLIKETINAIKPKELKINCLFGFSSPFDTGIILAVLGPFIPFIKADEININPDFENEIFEIDISAKGWFNLLSLILPMIRFIRVKPIWKLIKSAIF